MVVLSLKPEECMEPEQIIRMSNDELRIWTLQGDANSNRMAWGQAEANMRCAFLISTASAEMAAANRDLVEATKKVVEAHHGLIKQTKYLVYATWGLVVITLLSQLGLIAFEYYAKKQETSISSPAPKPSLSPSAAKKI
jgi:hypothetical protein